jgi:holo-[acyl-carrier protein] synthase
MIKGLGVDIVEIGRMRDALARHPRMKPEVHYALRFAAKEAVLKALGTGFAGMSFQDVEVVRDAGGRPSPKLHGRAAVVAEELGVVEMHLSLSYTHTTAVASAVAITTLPEPGGADPALLRARAFKDMRAIVDDVGPDEP